MVQRTNGMLVVALALLLLPAAAGAQEPAPPDTGSVIGVVRDADTGDPLAGTVVRIVELGREAVTHEDGSFHIYHMPGGSYTLIAERLGYARGSAAVRVPPDGATRTVLQLRPSAIELAAVVATGTVGEQLREEALRPTEVMSGRQLQRNIDVTLAETLKGQPGLASASNGPATARPVIRGLGGDRILLLEDGQRVGDLSATAPDHAVAIEPLTANRIEVLRGPATLLYGSNAIGGVVNVIREEIPTGVPHDANGHASLMAQSVNDGGGVEGAGVVPVSTHFVVRGEGSARRAGDLNTGSGVLINTGLDTYNLSGAGSFVETWGHVGAAYRYYDSSYGLPGGFVGAHEEGVNIELRRHSVRAAAEVRNGLGPFSAVTLDGTYNNYAHRELEHHGALGTEFGQLQTSAEALARHEGLGFLDNGAVGARFQWSDLAAGGSQEMPPSEEYTAAVFFIEEVDLAPLRLSLGARYDWTRVVPDEAEFVEGIGDVRTRTFGSVSGSLGALYEVADGVRLGASVARSYRTPAVNELFSRGPHLAAYTFEVGNPDLEDEVGLGVDVFARVSKDRLQAEVAAFRNEIDNYIFPRNTGRVSRVQLPVYQFTGADAVLQGFDGRLEAEVVDHVVLDGTFSFVEGTLTDTDRPLPLIPPFSGRLHGRYERTDWFVSAGFAAAAEQDRLGEFETATPGYTVWEASAGYRWSAFGRIHSLTLRGENLTDRLYFDHLSRTKTIMPEAGRNVALFYRLLF